MAKAQRVASFLLMFDADLDEAVINYIAEALPSNSSNAELDDMSVLIASFLPAFAALPEKEKTAHLQLLLSDVRLHVTSGFTEVKTQPVHQ